MELVNGTHGVRLHIDRMSMSQILYLAKSRGWKPAGAEPLENWHGDRVKGPIVYLDTQVRWSAADCAAMLEAIRLAWPGVLGWFHQLQYVDRVCTVQSHSDQRLSYDPFANWDMSPTVVESAFLNPESFSRLVQLRALLELGGPIESLGGVSPVGVVQNDVYGEPLRLRVRIKYGVQWSETGRPQHLEPGTVVEMPASAAGDLIGQHWAEPLFPETVALYRQRNPRAA